MIKSNFEALELQRGDYIWLLNESGQGCWGIYLDEYDRSKQTFSFRNNSNGQIEIIEIYKLQRLQRGDVEF